MNSILSLRGNYNSDGDSGSDVDETALIKVPDHLQHKTTKQSMEIVAAPVVITKYDINASRQVDIAKGKIQEILWVNLSF